MSESLWREAASLLSRTLELDDSERESVVQAECAKQPELGILVRRLFRLAGGNSDNDSPTLSDSLVATFGDGIDPGVEIETREVEAKAPPSADMLEELRAHPQHRRYDVIHEMARGGMGVIFRVWDRDLRRHVAMKVMIDDRDDGEKRLRRISRFLEEAQITGQLDHPGIVAVHELGFDRAERLFFTMQLVRGQTLSELIPLITERLAGWSLTRALSVVLRAGEAVAYAHNKGVIHRDLKPSNIMVGEFGETYVMDWGVAKLLRSPAVDPDAITPKDPLVVESVRRPKDQTTSSPIDTLQGDVIGTPVYMAPEQARGERDAIGPQSDVYSLGAVLYHLLCGQCPFKTPGLSAAKSSVVELVRETSPEPLEMVLPGRIPQELVAICERAMARDAQDRYPDMGAFVDDLRAFLENRVVRAHRVGAFAEFRKWVARNRSIAASLLVILIGTVSGLILVNRAEREASLSIASKNEELTQTGARLQEQNTALEQTQGKLQESLDSYRRLADEKIVRDLLDGSDSLWPRRPEKLPDFDDWIVQAEDVLGRADEHRQEWQRLQQQEIETQGTDHAWRLEITAELVQSLENLKTSATEGLPAIRARRRLAADIEEQTVDHHLEAWDEAISAIASDERFFELELEPQIGLIPLGPDPESDLWEFWLWESGSRPQRDSETGKLIPLPENGLVFILVPGGTFSMGADRNTDPRARPDEGPITELELAPYFLSKYELTQAQWTRFRADNPSHWKDEPSAASFPVEQIHWFDAQETLSRLGLTLPTEAQWERAARGGTDTPWFVGRGLLARHANLADASYRRRMRTNDATEAWDDGFGIAAPVGSFAANPFGFHDFCGNVWEWCRDGYADYETCPPRDGDGFRVAEDDRFRMTRGGSFRDLGSLARMSHRVHLDPDVRNYLIGVRPALTLDP